VLRSTLIPRPCFDSVVKLLIVASPREADLIRRSALEESWEALAIEAGDSLRSWLAASRPDLIVASTRAFRGDVRTTLSHIRNLPGGAVPVLVVCEAGREQELLDTSDERVLQRPVSVRTIIRNAQLLYAKSADSKKRIGARSVPTPSAQSGVSQVPTLRPLRPTPMPANTLAGAPAGNRTLDNVWLRDIAASIDGVLDADMAKTLGVETSGEAPSDAGFEVPFPRDGELTREVPGSFVRSVLAAPQPENLVKAFPTRGRLRTFGLAALMGQAFQNSLTGRLTIHQASQEKSLFFEAGRPVLAVSNVVADRMIQMLVNERTLTPHDAQQAVNESVRSGRRMGAVLVDLGLLKSSELLPAVRRHYEAIARSLFGLENADFSFVSGVNAEPRRVRLLQHPVQLVMGGLMLGASPEQVRGQLGPGDQVLRLESREGAPDILLEIGSFDPELTHLAAYFDGVRTLNDVIRISGQPAHKVRVVALTLKAFGLMGRNNWEVEGNTATSRESGSDDEIDRQRIRRWMTFVRQGSYFDVLGVSSDASAEAVDRAYRRLVQEVTTTAAHANRQPSEIQEDLEAIEAVVQEAGAVLRDPLLASAYRASLAPEPQPE